MGKWLEIYRAGEWRSQPAMTEGSKDNLVTWQSTTGKCCKGQVILRDTSGWVVVSGPEVPNDLAWVNMRSMM